MHCLKVECQQWDYMAKIKSIKHNKQGHTSNQKIGMGDFYGQGVKQKMGRVIVDHMIDGKVSSKKMGKPPRSMA